MLIIRLKMLMYGIIKWFVNGILMFYGNFWGGLCESVKIFGNAWKSMEINGKSRESIKNKKYDHPWRSMAIFGSL